MEKKKFDFINWMTNVVKSEYLTDDNAMDRALNNIDEHGRKYSL